MVQTPAFIVVAAVIPALAYALLLVALDGRRPRPWSALLASFFWGAVVAAFCSARVNDLVAAGLTAAAGEARALKAAGLLLLLAVRPSLLRSARDGIVDGAWIGLGFDLAENLEYLTLAAVQGGTAGLMRGMWVRGFLGGLKHAVFTGTVGAGIGWARDARSRRPRWVAQHAAWNAVASEAITRALCGAAAAHAACRATPADLALFVSVPLIVLLFVGPGALTLLAIARRGAGAR
jgi:RsiW-degrading membrane proteinase PrsW (M82 family)